jgi:hypothetical protein
MWLDFSKKTDSAHHSEGATSKRGAYLAAMVMLGHVKGSWFEYRLSSFISSVLFMPGKVNFVLGSWNFTHPTIFVNSPMCILCSLASVDKIDRKTVQ